MKHTENKTIEAEIEKIINDKKAVNSWKIGMIEVLIQRVLKERTESLIELFDVFEKAVNERPDGWLHLDRKAISELKSKYLKQEEKDE